MGYKTINFGTEFVLSTKKQEVINMVVDDEDRVKELLKRYSKFKPSKYNFLFIKHNEHFLFNTLSRCFIRILDKSSVLELINKKVINRKILLEI